MLKLSSLLIITISLKKSVLLNLNFISSCQSLQLNLTNYFLHVPLSLTLTAQSEPVASPKCQESLKTKDIEGANLMALGQNMNVRMPMAPQMISLLSPEWMKISLIQELIMTV